MIFGAVRGRGGPVEFLPLSGSCVPLIRFAFSDSLPGIHADDEPGQPF